MSESIGQTVAPKLRYYRSPHPYATLYYESMQTDLVMWQPLVFEPCAYGRVGLKLNCPVQLRKIVLVFGFSCRLCNSFQPKQTQTELQLQTQQQLQ